MTWLYVPTYILIKPTNLLGICLQLNLSYIFCILVDFKLSIQFPFMLVFTISGRRDVTKTTKYLKVWNRKEDKQSGSFSSFSMVGDIV